MAAPPCRTAQAIWVTATLLIRASAINHVKRKLSGLGRKPVETGWSSQDSPMPNPPELTKGPGGGANDMILRQRGRVYQEPNIGFSCPGDAMAELEAHQPPRCPWSPNKIHRTARKSGAGVRSIRSGPCVPVRLRGLVFVTKQLLLIVS
jgi:hypothetical protein